MNIRETKNKLVSEKKHDFESLRELTAVLRSNEGCMWDREQTHESIRNDIIEETYEVVEAIDKGDLTLLREELGDVLFQVIFHCGMETERGNFTVDDVINDVCAKMIMRHPHVFGNVSVNSSGEILDNWEKIKKEEKSRKTARESMQSVPKQLPSLMRAQKIIKKAQKDGCQLGTNEEIKDKIISLTDSLATAGADKRQRIVAEMIWNSVILAGADADAERSLGELTDEFIENYTDKTE